MNRHSTAKVAVLVVATATILVLTAMARESSAWKQLDLLMDIRHQLVSEYVEPVEQSDLVRSAVQGMIEALEDPHTNYITPEQMQALEQSVTGSFSGIGAEVDSFANRIRIVTPLEDSPAWESGVMAGDLILKIDGEDTLDMSLRDAVDKLTGEEGTEVTIRVRHESGEEEDITITRARINVPMVKGFRRNADQSFDYIIDDQHHIGYVRLTQFTERTVPQFRDVLKDLKQQGIKGLILDIRSNPGGLLEAAHAVADMFLPEGKPIVSVRGRSVSEKSYESTSDTVLPDVPLVVLANEGSASAAEIVAGALVDNDRAFVVGARTYGKGSVQTIRMLQGGNGALKLTTAYYYIPSGRNIHRRPDVDTWGVDPSPGGYVRISPENFEKLVEARIEHDKLRQTNGQNSDEPVTPEWIDETLKDPQLAAGLRAMLGKLETGDWPRVGEDPTKEVLRLTRLQDLERVRKRLLEGLDEVDEQLAELREADVDELSEEELAGDAAAVDADELDEQDPVESVVEDVPETIREQTEEELQTLPETLGEEADEQLGEDEPIDADVDEPAEQEEPALQP